MANAAKSNHNAPSEPLFPKESDMAQVPDLFEDLKSCYSESEEYSSEMEYLSVTQKSFYDASFEPVHENHVDKYTSLSTSETLRTSEFTLQESMVMVDNHRKKRKLSFNQFLTDEDLEAIAKGSAVQEEEIKPRSISYNMRSNVKYNFMLNKGKITMRDFLQQSISIQGRNLLAHHSQDRNAQVKFEVSSYMPEDDSEIPVTLRISGTQLYVSAQKEGEPVLLKEFAETPKTIKDETDILFIMETNGSTSRFKSVAYPDLYIATKEESLTWQENLLRMARGPPSNIDFYVWDN